MSEITDEIPLPNGPANLCFNKNDFLKDNFNVYQFVNDCRKGVPLETVREDLNKYLLVLKNAMIELINKDYADFVNLSTNLVGLEKMINNLIVPIGQLKEEILAVKSYMDEVVNKTKEKLERRKLIRDKKVRLQHLVNISLCVSKIEDLLGVEENKNMNNSTSKEINGSLMERVAVEFNQLHFHVTKSKGHVFVEEIKPRIIAITEILQNSLETMFLDGIKEKNIDKLRQCLRIHATIDRMKEVENLFRKHVVKPFMNEVITEEKMNSSSLQSIHDQILDFIPKYCDLLKEATMGNQNTVDYIHGYDFLVNAIWPEFMNSVEVRLSSLFAPANPDKFHARFTTTMQFLDKLEFHCGSQASVKRLREHQSYISFMNKWNLPIYFQIRFQNIAGKLETALISPWTPCTETSDFHLNVTHVLWQCLNICWSQDIYLYQLCHRFWKLSLQLVSRYCNWIGIVVKRELQKAESDSGPTVNENPVAISGIKKPVSIPVSSVVLLIVDIKVLVTKLSSYCDDVVHPQVQSLGFNDVQILKESMAEFQEFLSEQVPNLTSYITEDISQQCGDQLKLVSDIPRLYRRTNKDAPSKSSSYVSNILSPLESFFKQQENSVVLEMTNEWGLIILAKVTRQYYYATSNVLTSIKKMEESLSRLKKAREKVSNAASGSPSGMSDDDKIRLQLFLDVQEYGSIIDGMGFDKSTVDHYQDLVEMIESARTTPNKSN